MTKHCPVCAVGLTEIRVRSFEVDECRSCGGLWLDAGELNGLFGRPVESGTLPATAPTECRYCHAGILSGEGCTKCDRPAVANCARGHGVMGTTIIENGGEEVEIDVCETCSGIWLDGHECHQTKVVPAVLPVSSPTPRLNKTSVPNWQDYDSGSNRASSVLDRLDVDFLAIGDPRYLGFGMIGRREPLQVVVFVGFVIGAVFFVYRFVAPMLKF